MTKKGKISKNTEPLVPAFLRTRQARFKKNKKGGDVVSIDLDTGELQEDRVPLGAGKITEDGIEVEFEGEFTENESEKYDKYYSFDIVVLDAHGLKEFNVEMDEEEMSVEEALETTQGKAVLNVSGKKLTSLLIDNMDKLKGETVTLSSNGKDGFDREYIISG